MKQACVRRNSQIPQLEINLLLIICIQYNACYATVAKYYYALVPLPVVKLSH